MHDIPPHTLPLRFPSRDWYQAAQSLRTEDDQTTDSYLSPTDTILEEPEDEDNQDSQEATGSTIPPKASLKPSTEHARATRELRFHENVALVACFLGPLAGAWLLHTIRGALSRPAEGLVSDYNLTSVERPCYIIYDVRKLTAT